MVSRWTIEIFRKLAWLLELLLFTGMFILLEGSTLANDWRFYVCVAFGMLLYSVTGHMLTMMVS